MKLVLVAAMAGVLAIAPFPGSAGLRTGLLFLAAALVAAIQWRERDLPAPPWPRLVTAVFALWCALACLSLAWSIDPRFTASELRVEILYGAVAFATFFMAARFGTWTLWTRAVLAGTFAVFVLNILQEVLPFAISRHSVLGQGGMWSTHLVIAAPFVLAMGWSGPARVPGGPVLRIACLALIVAAALQTGNRTVWVALAAELVVASLLSRRLLTPEEWRREMRPMAVAGIAIVGAFLFVVRDRAALVMSGPGHAIGWAFDLRPQIWAVAWEQFRDAPWVGHGFGREIVARAFALVVPPPELHHPPILHAHNVFIDAALQLGVAGLAALLAVFAALAREFRACLRDRDTVAFGIVGLTLLAGFVVKNLTDDFLHRHNGLMFWAANGLLLGLARLPVRRAMNDTAANGGATPAQRAEFERTGFLAFDPGIDEGTIDRAFARLKALYPPEGSAWDNMGGAVPYRDARRIQDAWKIDADVKAIATAPRVLAMLRSLYGREPLPFQTLNFSVGSEQKTHSDTVHFNSRPAGYMCGVWVALEDIDSRNGPVMYYPGTHAWKELALPDIDAFEPPRAPTGRLARILAFLGVPARNTDEDYARYERLVQSRLDAAGAQPVYATIRKGEAFIWAANLLHGGSPQLDRARTRMSQVTHYFFEGCRYYTPLLQRGWKTRWRRPDWIR